MTFYMDLMVLVNKARVWNFIGLLARVRNPATARIKELPSCFIGIGEDDNFWIAEMCPKG